MPAMGLGHPLETLSPRFTKARRHSGTARRLIIPCGRLRLVYRGWPLVMGILNVTPDSFSDGGCFLDPRRAVQHGLTLSRHGADLLDVGGESTRPGAVPVAVDEELARVVPVIQRLASVVQIPIAVDTSKAAVADAALAGGASIVNDVSALRSDPGMAAVVARHRAAVILMHRRGTPSTMQRAPRYRDVVEEVARFLAEAAGRAQEAGIPRSRILIDPGLGFGKTVAHNLSLMRHLDRLISLGYPVVVGPSRKTFIGRTLQAEVHDRLAGTLACVAYAERLGAQLVRVHDVQETAHLLAMLTAIEGARCNGSG